MRRFLFVAIAVIAVSLPSLARSQGVTRRLGGENGPRRAADVKKVVPRLPDGKIDLNGVWTGGGDGAIERQLKPGELKSIMLPWAQKLHADRNAVDGLDPYFSCMPGGPLRITGGFGWRLVQYPTTNTTHIFMLQEGNAHTYRQIFMDGRKHPEDPSPTWYGHSIGRWDGDTLVADTIGLNDRFWLDTGGAPHTEKLHLVEKWTRPDYNTLSRVVTIDDSGAFTRPFDVKFTAKIATPESEIMEYICIENNQYGLAQGKQLPLTGGNTTIK